MKIFTLVITLVCSLFISSCAFASNTTMQPASIQRIANGMPLTCPTRKWCKVVVIVSHVIQATGTGTVNNQNETFEFILKSGEIAEWSFLNIGASSTSGRSTASLLINGSTIFTFVAVLNGTSASTNSTIGSYGLISHEYYN